MVVAQSRHTAVIGDLKDIGEEHEDSGVGGDTRYASIYEVLEGRVGRAVAMEDRVDVVTEGKNVWR